MQSFPKNKSSTHPRTNQISPGDRSSTQPRTTKSLPGNRFSAHPPNRAFPTGPREPPPRIASPGFGKPPTRMLCIVFPALYQAVSYRLPRKGGYPKILRKKLTLLPGLVRKPRHLPLGLQPRSPERFTHDSLSIYRNAELFRTWHTSLPDSTDKLRRPAGQSHL